MSNCEECGQNAANVQITQIIQNETTVFNLCEECARKKGISISIEEAEAIASSLNSGVIAPVALSAEASIICPYCHLSYADFKNGGWLGCDACYYAFDKQLDQLFKQVHGAVEHKGKQYGRRSVLGVPINPPHEITRLRQDLADAIAREEFELAASLRDAIHAHIPQAHGATA